MRSSSKDRFRDVSRTYTRFRPDYPDKIVRAVARRIVALPAVAARPVFDVGCGTGIFTRQLASMLPDDVAIVGIEPSDAMRKEAINQSAGTRLIFREGAAESLPPTHESARAITAATAAHWFNRTKFYDEAARVLMPGGILAIVEYVRDADHSSPAAAVEDFLARESEAKVYRRPDYTAEIGAREEFDLCEAPKTRMSLPLSVNDFVGLVLSSSHAKAVVARLGEAEAAARLAQLGAGFKATDGLIPYGYRFEAFIAQRR